VLGLGGEEDVNTSKQQLEQQQEQQQQQEEQEEQEEAAAAADDDAVEGVDAGDRAIRFMKKMEPPPSSVSPPLGELSYHPGVPVKALQTTIRHGKALQTDYRRASSSYGCEGHGSNAAMVDYDRLVRRGHAYSPSTATMALNDRLEYSTTTMALPRGENPAAAAADDDIYRASRDTASTAMTSMTQRQQCMRDDILAKIAAADASIASHEGDGGGDGGPAAWRRRLLTLATSPPPLPPTSGLGTSPPPLPPTSRQGATSTAREDEDPTKDVVSLPIVLERVGNAGEDAHSVRVGEVLKAHRGERRGATRGNKAAGGKKKGTKTKGQGKAKESPAVATAMHPILQPI